MVEIKPGLLPSMALGFEAQRAQLVTPLTPATLFGAAQMGETWHVLLDGKVVAFGGHFPAWAGRNVVWGYLSKDAGPAIRAMTACWQMRAPSSIAMPKRARCASNTIRRCTWASWCLSRMP